MNRRVSSLFFVATIALCGCSSEVGLTEAEITERVTAFDTSGEFTQVNAAPFPSQHAAETVSVWSPTRASPPTSTWIPTT